MVLRTLILTTALGVLTLAAEAQPYQILASYPFDDGTAMDATGNGHNGILSGGPLFVPGVVGQAIRFDGTNDYVQITNSPELSTQSVSLSLWILIDELPVSDQVLIHKTAGQTGYALWISGTSHAVSFGTWDGVGGEAQVEAPFPVVAGLWTAITASYDGTDLTLSLHGREEALTSAPGLPIATSGDLFFGRGGVWDPYKGAMDQVIIAEGAAPPDTVCGDALKLWDPVSQTCIGMFTDLTDSLDLGDTAHRHFGLAVIDVNDDGWVDLYYPNGLENPVNMTPPSGTCPEPSQIDPPPPENFNTFFLNNGDGTFTGDVAASVGLDDWWNAMRHAFADYDNDGLRDVISHNFIKSTVYRQVSSNPLLFEDANQATGIDLCITNGTGASWVDVNNDGWLDLYGCEYDANRTAVEHVNKMFLSDGDGTFTDITTAAGLTLPDNPMGVTFADYDNDGDQDFFVTNSHDWPAGVPSRLYRNNGPDSLTGIPTFTDVAPEAGVDIVGDPGRGFSVAWGDYDNDGRLDMLYGREEDSRLFHNNGPNGLGVWTFSDVTQQGGLNFDELVFQDGNFGDLDNDGNLDVLMANASGPNRVFMNNGDGTWTETGTLVGMEQPVYANQGVVPADVDNDGDLDVVWYAHRLGEPNKLYRNDDRGNNWVQFRLTGTVSNRDAVGARIYVEAETTTGSAVTQMREIMAGTGFFSDLPRIQTFGLGKAQEILSVEVHWPSGQIQVVPPPAVNQRHDIVESGVTGVDGPGGAVPDRYLLSQNFPNPFNPVTVIQYALPEASRVRLVVYDMLGREVAVLVDGIAGAGLRTVSFDASDLASGVYFYRVDATSVTGNASFSKINKMVLLQ